MNPNAILEFLRDNPHFLDEHAHLLTPETAAKDSRVLSLTERQLRTLREQNASLERQMRELLRAGADNDAIGERLHRVTLAFFVAHDLSTTLGVLRQSLSEHFQVPYTIVRLWAAPHDTARTFSECLPVSPDLQDYADTLDAPYCGRDVSTEIRSWFRETPAPSSFALIPLRTQQTFGLLALASPDEQRFHVGMGTNYLTRLSELASVALARHLSAR